MNTYRFVFSAQCPNDGVTIIYGLELCSTTTIMVEDIRAACAKFKSAFQEDIAQALHEQFRCGVSLRAQHQGIEVLTELPSPSPDVDWAWMLANTDRFARD